MSTSRQPNILCLMEKQHRHLFVGVHHVNREYIYLFLALAGRSLTWVGAHVGQTCDQLGGCFPLFTDWTSKQENICCLEMIDLTSMATRGRRLWVQKDLGVLTSIFYLQSTITFYYLLNDWKFWMSHRRFSNSIYLSWGRKSTKWLKKWRQVFCNQSKLKCRDTAIVAPLQWCTDRAELQRKEQMQRVGLWSCEQTWPAEREVG